MDTSSDDEIVRKLAEVTLLITARSVMSTPGRYWYQHALDNVQSAQRNIERAGRHATPATQL